MSTTIHIPQPLLNAIDRKIEKLDISRNKFICMVLTNEVAKDWPAHFLSKKFTQDKKLIETADEMITLIKSKRANKKQVNF